MRVQFSTGETYNIWFRYVTREDPAVPGKVEHHRTVCYLVPFVQKLEKHPDEYPINLNQKEQTLTLDDGTVCGVGIVHRYHTDTDDKDQGRRRALERAIRAIIPRNGGHDNEAAFKRQLIWLEYFKATRVNRALFQRLTNSESEAA